MAVHHRKNYPKRWDDMPTRFGQFLTKELEERERSNEAFPPSAKRGPVQRGAGRCNGTLPPSAKDNEPYMRLGPNARGADRNGRTGTNGG